MDIDHIKALVVERLTIENLIIALIVPTIVAILKFLGIKILTNLRAGFEYTIAVFFALPRYLQLLQFVQNGKKSLWEYRRFGNVELRDIPPVITVMNFKGGVGKTTIAANLAACLSSKHQKKVLLVDLDYQGSLSSELIPIGTNIQKYGNTISRWLQSKTPPSNPSEDFLTPSGLEGVRLLTSNYELSDIEENQFQRWLLKAKTNGDVRSRLARHLRAIRNKEDCNFDLIIMDAPPRLSLAAANAVRSSTMILIPVRLQYLAAQPVRRMLSRLSTFKAKSGGKFQIGGVVCNFTSNKQRVSGREQEHLDTITEALAGHPDNPIIFNTLIPDTPDIGSSNARPAYLSEKRGPNAPAPIFDQLTEEILEKLRHVSG